MQVISDFFGRTFSYLRLSLTDVCNFRCSYCLPSGFQEGSGREAVLSLSEIRRLVSAFAAMGFWKIRLTGGEPTVRRDIVEIAQIISGVPGVRKLFLSTNGYSLSRIAKDLKEAGVAGISISVDSLDPQRFAAITSQNKLTAVLNGVEKALELGFHPVKINTVLLNSVNDGEVDDFIEWTRNTPLSVRFIELMETGNSSHFFTRYHLSMVGLEKKLFEYGFHPKAREDGAGPAVEYTHADYQGSVGLIAPYSKDFCTGCNRVRVDCRGQLLLCLFGNGGYQLRHLLASDSQQEELQQTVRDLIQGKAKSHFLAEQNFGSTCNLAMIGG